MKIKTVFFCLQLLALTGYADDLVMPTFKKEIIPALPHIWFSEGMLFYKAQGGGLCYADQSQAIGAANYTNTPAINPHFAWNFGLKIDVGYQPRDFFYFANWTYIQNTAQGQNSTNGSSGFSPVLSLNPTKTSSTYVTSGDLFWKLNTNTGDLGTIFSWRPYSHLILKNRVSLKIASINQQFRVHYSGGDYSDGTDTLNMHNNFYGAGPSVGLSPNILLPKGFSIIGDLTASAIMGGFWLEQKETYLTETLFYANSRMARLRWMLDAKVALAWQREFLYKGLVFGAQIGWEWQEFFHQNQLQHSTLDQFNDNRNILLRGGYFSASIGF